MLLFLNQTNVFGKVSDKKDFNQKYLSNYFSALLSYDNQENEKALQYFEESKDLINSHESFLKEYVFALVLDGQIEKAISKIKFSKNLNTASFFEAKLLLALDLIKKNKFKKAVNAINKIDLNDEKNTYEFIIFKTLASYNQLFIDKKIPYNSGLGGGSSDAGAVIRYLCDNYELDLPSNLEIVREVGSDVPFFIQGVSAVIQGIGEIVEPLDLNADLDLLIAVPKVGLSTKDVFNTFDTLDSKNRDTDTWNAIEIFNDLWPAATEVYPELVSLRDGLQEKYQNKFFMSGSGSSFFSFIEAREELKPENVNFNFLQYCKKIDCSLYQNDD